MATRQAKGSDLFDLLRKEHEEITGIIHKVKRAGDQEKQQLLDQMNDALTDHMKLEEELVYPVLEDMEELSDAVQESLSEHNEIEDLLHDVMELEYTSEEWQTMLLGLEEAKDTHVQAEENEIFPKARELMSDEELARLSDEVMTERGIMSLKAPPQMPGKEQRPQR